MKNIIYLILAILFISCTKKERNTNVKNQYQQDILNHRFLSDVVLGSENDILKINLWRDNRNHYFKSAGISTSFLNDSFGSGNFAPCGNDYFIDVNGKFILYDTNKITISADSLTYSGEDKRPTAYKNGEETDYSISKKGDTITLTKID
ncbi:hypothetical protein PGH12_07755 [Chryseobacterium wangxinyae]|uniref:hypothetical protein n=1 Tax=Chryseobacterium sp. CY350 TaxID=2997336 RepID=UPI00226ECBA6|nr:hypothetical protein [Chryseobacterium sp. CY350]MCY0977039.1 hypothetical protein [Chryseobacterium sp. CY350]WBZ97038.1 hypothetical protein PGH12_07755 [Chryseobacterium sp. CY350]